MRTFLNALVFFIFVLACTLALASDAAQFWNGDHLAARKYFLNENALSLPSEKSPNAPAYIQAQRAYYIAAILEHCERQFMLEALVKKTPDIAARPAPTDSQVETKAKNALAIYRAATECAAMRGYTSEGERKRAWETAAATGDPRAAAVLAHKEFRKEHLRQHPDTSDPQWKMIDDPQPELINMIQAALSTRDPAIIVSLGPFMAENFYNTHFLVHVGDAKAASKSVSTRESFSAELSSTFFNILACEFGAECRPDKSWVVVRACARGAGCDAKNLEDYYSRYVFSEADRAQLRRLKPIVKRAIMTGDWSAFSLVKRTSRIGRFNSPGPGFSVR